MSFVRSTAFEGLARSYTAASCSLNCLFFCAKSFHYLCRDLYLSKSRCGVGFGVGLPLWNPSPSRTTVGTGMSCAPCSGLTTCGGLPPFFGIESFVGF